MPLTMAKMGEDVTIARVSGTDGVRQHLAELGLIPGEMVTVVSANDGNLIVHVKDSRIALDKSMANRVFF